MSVIQLNGTLRDDLGKGGARKARAAGRIPGVVYGHGEKPMAVSIDGREFTTAMRAHKGGNPIVNLKVGGGEYTTLVRDAQIDPLSRQVVHLDFQHVSLTETIEVDVPVHAVGLADGVKNGGGVLELITRQLKVRCLPTTIPAGIDVDVTALAVGASIHVSEITVVGVTILTDPHTTVVTVVAPTVEAEPVPVEGVAPVETTEPEVVGAKGKKEEGEGETEKEKEKVKDRDKDKEKK